MYRKILILPLAGESTFWQEEDVTLQKLVVQDRLLYTDMYIFFLFFFVLRRGFYHLNALCLVIESNSQILERWQAFKSSEQLWEKNPCAGKIRNRTEGQATSQFDFVYFLHDSNRPFFPVFFSTRYHYFEEPWRKEI